MIWIDFVMNWGDAEQENMAMDLQGEVMACAYEDVQVMWSMLDKSKARACNVSS